MHSVLGKKGLIFSNRTNDAESLLGQKPKKGYRR